MDGAENELTSGGSSDESSEFESNKDNSNSEGESQPQVVAPTTLKRAVSGTDSSKDSSDTANDEEMVPQSTRKRAATPFHEYTRR